MLTPSVNFDNSTVLAFGNAIRHFQHFSGVAPMDGAVALGEGAEAHMLDTPTPTSPDGDFLGDNDEGAQMLAPQQRQLEPSEQQQRATRAGAPHGGCSDVHFTTIVMEG